MCSPGRGASVAGGAGLVHSRLKPYGIRLDEKCGRVADEDAVGCRVIARAGTESWQPRGDRMSARALAPLERIFSLPGFTTRPVLVYAAR